MDYDPPPPSELSHNNQLGHIKPTNQDCESLTNQARADLDSSST